MPFKPFVSVMVVERFEQPFHQAMTSRIDSAQVLHTVKRIGAVAPSAARDFHLSQHTLPPLEDGHFHFGHHLFQIDSQKESCRSAADYRCFHGYKSTTKSVFYKEGKA
jgi:hypothetical protein